VVDVLLADQIEPAEEHGDEAQIHAVERFRTNSWVRFLTRRFVNLLIVLVCLILFDFLILRLIPGNPAQILAGVTGDQGQAKVIQHELGLDQSFPHQILTYVTNLAHGNLGHSFETNQPVTQIITQRIGSSLELAGAALLLVLLVSIPLGMLMGVFTREQRHRKTEVIFTAVTSVFGALPDYFMATILLFAFAFELKLLPISGAGLQGLVLPTLAIAIPSIAVLSRVVRVETLNVLTQDYIRTARSKRLPRRLIYMRHALPNVSTAALTIGGILFAQLIGGAIIVENVFDRNGLGSTIVQAVLSRDYPVVQGVVLVLGVIIVLVNTIIDVILALIDPRTRNRLA
jgi:peptide/nickel transport system permease protein